MIGVIIVPGQSPQMYGLDAKRSLALLPVGDRPLLQHIVEALAAQGITSMELIVEHAPKEVEALLGNGDRWGCRFRYHLSARPDRPYRAIKVIAELKKEPWCLIHADRYPFVEFASQQISGPTIFCGTFSSDSSPRDLEAETNSSHEMWGGAAIFPDDMLLDKVANLTKNELARYLESMVVHSHAAAVSVRTWLDGSTPSNLLQSQTLLLNRQLDGLMIGGLEREAGIWIARNVAIHPSVDMLAPIYVGPNSRLNAGVKVGPNAVIEGDCIVDVNTTIEHSLVKSGSYVGEGLELNHALVDHNLLINARLGASVDIAESFLLGGLKRPLRQDWFLSGVQCGIAALLMILFLPVSALSAIFYTLVKRIPYTFIETVELPAKESELSSRKYALPCLGVDAWDMPPGIGWTAFLRQFLPGLVAVVAGRLSFVGLPPRTENQIRSLSAEWRELYLRGKAGLISEAALAQGDPGDMTQLYLADAYYTVKQDILHDLELVCRYFLRLMVL